MRRAVAVEVDSEETADEAQAVDMVAGDCMDVVRRVAVEDIINVRLQSRKRVRPDIGRSSHQALIRRVVELLQLTAQHLHPVAAVEPRQAGRR